MYLVIIHIADVVRDHFSHIHDNHAKFNIDNKRIAVAGDRYVIRGFKRWLNYGELTQQ